MINGLQSMVMHFVWIFSVVDCQHYTFIFPWYMVLVYQNISVLEYDIVIVENPSA